MACGQDDPRLRGDKLCHGIGALTQVGVDKRSHPRL